MPRLLPSLYMGLLLRKCKRVGVRTMSPRKQKNSSNEKPYEKQESKTPTRYENSADEFAEKFSLAF
jgi:hypothetical protein